MTIPPRSDAATGGDLGKTQLRRLDQYRDRWTSRGNGTGLLSLSDKPSPAELAAIELFADYDDKFLERISPDVSIAVWERGSVLFEEGSYLDLAFFVLEGTVEVAVHGLAAGNQPAPIFDLSRTVIAPGATTLGASDAGEAAGSPTRRHPRHEAPTEGSITFLSTIDFDLPAGAAASLGPGELFGEIGAMSGWPQSVTARCRTNCKLVQIRVPALRMMKRKSRALSDRLDGIYRRRSLAAQLKTTPLFADCSEAFLADLQGTVELVSCEPGEALVRQGEPVDALYLVRSGFLKLSQRLGEGELAFSYLSKGMTLGEVELMLDGLDSWEVSAASVEYAELVRIPRAAFERLLAAYPGLEEGLWQTASERIREAGRARRHVGHTEFTEVALDQGLVQGSSILVIDLESCTRCDDCVRGCASTHGGRPRFVREGDKYKNLLIARSCYHCRDPVCLVGCPTGAIHRAGVADVVAIDDRLCIGCSTCANNCPYDAIVMHDTGETWPDDMVPVGLRGRQRDVASKCDQCFDTGHGPACVESCPHGCAFRVGSLAELEALLVEEP